MVAGVAIGDRPSLRVAREACRSLSVLMRMPRSLSIETSLPAPIWLTACGSTEGETMNPPDADLRCFPSLEHGVAS